MATLRRVERWRQLVNEEGRGLPVGLVLAIIHHESKGVAGKESGQTTKEWGILREDGSYIQYNHALGLMQIIPGTIASYNENHTSAPIYYEEMSGSDDRSARLQIRMGVATFMRGVRNLHDWDPIEFGAGGGNAEPEQLKLALLAYRMGWGALKKRLVELRAKGHELTFESVEEHYPNWGLKAGNKPIYYVHSIWNLSKEYGVAPTKPEGGGMTENNTFFPAGSCCCRDRRDRGFCPLVAAQKGVAENGQ